MNNTNNNNKLVNFSSKYTPQIDWLFLLTFLKKSKKPIPNCLRIKNIKSYKYIYFEANTSTHTKRPYDDVDREIRNTLLFFALFSTGIKSLTPSHSLFIYISTTLSLSRMSNVTRNQHIELFVPLFLVSSFLSIKHGFDTV